MAEPVGPGSEVLGYRLERLLGRGGMGTVYLATQLGLGRQVAVKLLHAHKVADLAATQALLAEARLAGRLHHPHLVVIHDLLVDPAQGIFGYAMEHVPGETVAGMVRDEGPLTRSSALEITRQVAAALAEAHRHGFIHRDVKPDNILITPSGQAKLLDLGLAANRLGGLPGVAASGGNRRLVIVGTPDYMAPEQARNPEHASRASDVWSLGATLVFLMTGRPPFDGSTVIDLFVRTATEPLRLPGDFPEDLTLLLQGMLAKDPERRPGDGQAVLELLQRIDAGRLLPERPAPAKPPVIRPVRRPLVRRRPR